MGFYSLGEFGRLRMDQSLRVYSRSPTKVENPIASILKSNTLGVPARVVLHPVSNFWGFTCLNPKRSGSARQKHISKHKDRDIPYKPPYNEAHSGRDIPVESICLCAFWLPNLEPL